MPQGIHAIQAGRPGVLHAERVERIRGALALVVERPVLVVVPLGGDHHLAARLHVADPDVLAHVGRAIASIVVPHHFEAALRNRERNTETATTGSVQAQVVIGRRATAGVLDGVVQHLLRIGCSTAGLVNVDVEVGVLLHHFHGARRQPLLVLSHVLRINAQHWLVFRKRIGTPPRTCWIIIGRRLGETAGVLGNRAVGIAGFLRAPRGQRGA
ncbi:hypothetical protein D9M71_577420 [compost metagenome]